MNGRIRFSVKTLLLLLCALVLFGAFGAASALTTVEYENMLEDIGISDEELEQLTIRDNIVTVADPSSRGSIAAAPNTIYRFPNGGTLNSGRTGSGFAVPADTAVVIEIPSGKTLEIFGGYDKSTGAAMPAVHLPAGSTLVIRGGGKLIAHGTDADSGRNTAAAPGIGGAAGTGARAPEGCGDVFVLDGTVDARVPENRKEVPAEIGVLMGIDAGGACSEGGRLPFHGNVYIAKGKGTVTGSSRPLGFRNGEYMFMTGVDKIERDEKGIPYATPRYYVSILDDYGLDWDPNAMTYQQAITLALRGLAGYYNRFCDGKDTWFSVLNAPASGRTSIYEGKNGLYYSESTGKRNWYKVLLDNSDGYFYLTMKLVSLYTNGYVGDYKDYGRDDARNDDIYGSISATKNILRKKLMPLSPDATATALLDTILDEWMYDEHWCDPFKAKQSRPIDYEHPLEHKDAKDLTPYDFCYFTVVDSLGMEEVTFCYETNRREYSQGCSDFANYYIKCKKDNVHFMYVAFDVYLTKGETVNQSNWMSTIPDDAFLHMINIPGTHDSGCFNMFDLFPFAPMIFTTQTKSIGEQLNAGIRVMDIRLTDSDRKGSVEFRMHICHGPSKALTKDGKYTLTFNLVLDDIKAFLKAHPTETVILTLQGESEGSHYKEYINELKHKYWMKPDGNGSFKGTVVYLPCTEDTDPSGNPVKDPTPVPALGSVRGKIIMVDSHAITKYEDDYENVDEPIKIEALTRCFTESRDLPQLYDQRGIFKKQNDTNNPDERLVFSSQYALRPIPNPIAQAVEINRWMAKYQFIRGRKYGWIMMNDPIAQQIRNIILSNYPQHDPLVIHDHDWTFSIPEENTLLAKCKAPNCPAWNSQAKLVLETPDMFYTGKAYPYATFTEWDAWTQYVSRLPGLTYQQQLADGSWSAETADAPSAVGSYRANATYVCSDESGRDHSYTIRSYFQIQGLLKMEVSGVDKVYDGVPATVAVKALDPATGVQFQYMTDGQKYSTTAPEFVNAGKYTVHVRGSAYGYGDAEAEADVIIRKAGHDDETLEMELYNAPETMSSIALPELPEGARYDDTGLSEKAPAGLWIGVTDGSRLTIRVAKELEHGHAPFTVTVPVKNAANYNDYKVTVTVTVTDHEHVWQYLAEGDTLIAQCVSKKPCTLPPDDRGRHLVKAVIRADDMDYTGYPYSAEHMTLTGSGKWNSVGAGILTVSFEGLADAPVNAGNYEAVLTCDAAPGVRAKDSFTIHKAVYPDVIEAWTELYNEVGFSSETTLPELPEGAVYSASGMTGVPSGVMITLNGRTFKMTVGQKQPNDPFKIRIPVKDAVNYKDFEVLLTVHIVNHTHVWRYSSEGSYLLAWCTASRCTLPAVGEHGDRYVAVQLLAADMAYTGDPYPMENVTIANKAAWDMYGAGELQTAFKGDTVPVNAGSYTASLWCTAAPDVKATADFSITKAPYPFETEFATLLYNVAGTVHKVHLPPLPEGAVYSLDALSGLHPNVKASITEDSGLLLEVTEQIDDTVYFELSLAVNDSDNYLPYELHINVLLTDHIHDWKYTAHGNELSAQCVSERPCPLNHRVITVSVSAEDMVYTGRTYPETNVTVEGLDVWENQPGIAPVDRSFSPVSAPSDIGKYRAEISAGEGSSKATASCPFEIVAGRIVDVTDVEANALHARISGTLDPILVAEDRKTGAEIELVSRIIGELDPDERALIKSKMLRGESIGTALDLTLFKTVLGERIQLHTLPGGSVAIQVQLPESLWKHKGRTFSVVRVHNGSASRLDSEYDAKTHTLTFNASRFSTYAIVYKDPVSPVPPTGDGNPPAAVVAALGLMSLAGLAVVIRRMRRA